MLLVWEFVALARLVWVFIGREFGLGLRCVVILFAGLDLIWVLCC